MIDDRLALVGFNLTSGIGPARLRQLLDYCGSAAAAWAATPDDWRAAGLNRPAVQALLAARATLDLAAEWAAIGAAGLTVALEADAAYPARLRTLTAPPPLLYLKGALVAGDTQAVALVGTRAPTAYGREVARQLATDLASAGITVVSGLALGIDAHAHRGALERGGRTLAVLGSGLARVYPPQHVGLAAEIVGQGALISEYAPTTSPLGGNFPARNRLISGLALAVVVIEAGARSGALITAQFALDQNRDVMAVPGSILSRASDGPNQLIADGAVPVRSAGDIVAQLRLDQQIARDEICAVLAASPAEQSILDALALEPRHLDEIGHACGLNAADTAATVGILELKGAVRHLGGLHYVLAQRRMAPAGG